MHRLASHSQRYELANELHARPFPKISSPGQAAHIAISDGGDARNANSLDARAYLIDLLDRFGVAHPAPNASHYFAELDRVGLKWERHSEFVTYTLFAAGLPDKPFGGDLHDFFPKDWLEKASGELLTSAIVQYEIEADTAAIERRIAGDIRTLFVGESMTASYVLDQQAAIVGDFRIDSHGHVRFFVLGANGVGKRRMGRIVQRLLEIETYKTMAMLTLPVAREVFGKLAEYDLQLSAVVEAMTDQSDEPSETLERLLAISSKIELLSSSTAFRFGAGRAYAALVAQRIDVVREERLRGRQMFSEFMMRRFDPATRTCTAAHERLLEISSRASTAAGLLGTRVSVKSTEQNRQLLQRMDERAALQLRLQETVEGLSVVAISYYALSLMAYLVAPLAEPLHISKASLIAILVLPVALAVWLLVQRIKKRAAGRES